MRHWLTQIVLLGACMLFLAKLPALGSLTAALVASVLAVATVGVTCLVVDRLTPDPVEQPVPHHGPHPYAAS